MDSSCFVAGSFSPVLDCEVAEETQFPTSCPIRHVGKRGGEHHLHGCPYFKIEEKVYPYLSRKGTIGFYNSYNASNLHTWIPPIVLCALLRHCIFPFINRHRRQARTSRIRTFSHTTGLDLIGLPFIVRADRADPVGCGGGLQVEKEIHQISTHRISSIYAWVYRIRSWPRCEAVMQVRE